MKIGKACILAVSAVAVSAAFAEVKYGDNNWQAVAGVYSGCITNGAHWSRGSVPDVSIDGAVTNYQAGVFTVHPGVPYTVSFPTGNFECAGGLYIKLAEGDDITFDGTDTLFRHAPAPWDRYPYRIAIGTSKLAYILDTNWREGGNGQLSNFTYRVAMSGNTASLELQKGLYDYITDSHAFSPSLFADASTLQRASVVLGDGVNVRCGALLVYAQTAAENILAATGSAITVSSDVSVVGTSGKKVAVSLADSSFSSTGFNVSGGEIDVVFDSVSARLAGMNMGNGSRIGWSVRDSFITNSNTSGVSFKLGAVAGANTTAVDITDSEVYFLRNVDLGVADAAASLTLCVTNSVFSKLPELSNSAGYIIHFRVIRSSTCSARPPCAHASRSAAAKRFRACTCPVKA